jgi:hypothetical membrane protein
MTNNLRLASSKTIETHHPNFRFLLWGGILGPVVYVLNVILGGIITPHYSHSRNAISELTQRGAPNIVLLSTIFVLSAILIMLFGIAILLKYRQQGKWVYVGSALIVVYAVLAALMATVFPQDPLGTESTVAGTLHLVLAGLAAFAIMGSILLIGLGIPQRNQYWRHFRTYSVISFLLVFFFGLSTPILIINQIELLGTFERLTQLAYLQWFATLAYKSYTDVQNSTLK